MMLQGIILDRASPVSLRRQLVGHLETRILGGQIPPGRRLPSVRRVEEVLGLHRNTVAAAYRELVHAGLARTRPGSGVYVRSPSHGDHRGCGTATVLGSRDIGLDCPDPQLEDVLKAELRSRLAVRVHRSYAEGPQVSIRLSVSACFVRALDEARRPSLVAVVSRSNRVHKLMASATLVHGGDGIAFLPVTTGNRDDVARADRLASLVFADHASLGWARHKLTRRVAPLPLLSGHSWSELTLLLRRNGYGPGTAAARRSRMERSVLPSVREP